MGTNMHMIYNIKCFTGLFNVSRETFDTTAFDTTLIFNESHECPVAADMQCALVCSLAHITSYFQECASGTLDCRKKFEVAHRTIEETESD